MMKWIWWERWRKRQHESEKVLFWWNEKGVRTRVETLTDTSNLARVLHRRSRCNRCKFLFYSHLILTLPGLYLDILEVKKNKLASNILSTSLFKHYIYLALIFSYLVSRSAMTGVSVLLFAFLLLCCYNFHLESHQVESKLSSIVD